MLWLMIATMRGQAQHRWSERAMFGPIRRVSQIAAVAFLVSATPASATTVYDLTATSTAPSLRGNFTIRFDDTSGDGLLQFGEIVPNGFSGVTIPPTTYTSVACIPNIEFATASGASGSCSSTLWTFVIGGSTNSTDSNGWRYALAPVSAVPLPPALLLFASALGLMGLLRWWRSRKMIAQPMAA